MTAKWVDVIRSLTDCFGAVTRPTVACFLETSKIMNYYPPFKDICIGLSF